MLTKTSYYTLFSILLLHLLMTAVPSLLMLGPTNTLLTLEVDSASSSPTFQCQFQNGVTGTASCLVRYGSDPTYTDLPFQEQVMQNFTNGGTITVPLSNLHSQNLTLVYYVVLAQTGSQSVSVMGIFQTGEWCSDDAEFHCIKGYRLI